MWVPTGLLRHERDFPHTGAWHVEGMRDERIVATAIYYASSENVKASRLEFRTACAEPDYEHYARKQIEPLLATIAQVSPIDVESAMKGAASLFGAEVWADLKRKGQ